MLVAIIGLIALLTGVVVGQNSLITIGYGFILFDIVLELAILNTNLRVVVHNMNIYWERLKKEIQEVIKAVQN